MGYKESQNEILELIEAKYPLMYVVSDDEIPVVNTLTTIAEQSDYDVITWNVASGLFCEHGKYDKKGFESNSKTLEERVVTLFDFIKKYDKDSIFVLEDFDYVFNELKQSALGLKDVVQSITLPISKEKGLKRHILSSNYKKHIVVVSPNQYIPKEIEKLINVVYFGMPGKEEISKVIDIILENTNGDIENTEKEKIIQSSIGLTEPELINALYNSIMSEGHMSASKLSSIKEQIIQKGGLIEFIKSPKKNNEVGGMANLIEWVKKREIAFNEEKRKARNLQYPKGILLTGVPGCGKSHSVKWIAEHLNLPLLRLDMGSLMGKYVGQSEENLRKALSLAKSVAPAVLWIDEIEKSFPDPRSGNTHEVSNRLLSKILTWLQEKEEPVFVVATANNIDKLPPELLRKGRFSEIFFVDLPKAEERAQIFGQKLENFDVSFDNSVMREVIEKTEGYSGAEIEEIVREANFQSAYDEVNLNIDYLLNEIERTTPMSVLKKDDIAAIKTWAVQNKVRPAN